MLNQREQDDIRNQVRESYGKVAVADDDACGCAPAAGGCCGGSDPEDASLAMGYSVEDVAGVPQGANMGLGCGNPQAIASLKPGEVVLDLGSGGGFDCFLAAKRVGSTGRVLGVDMTPAMVSKARANAEKVAAENIEFRLGEIEALPVADASVDVIISNCVINLSPDKARVFKEAHRVLKAGGRLAVSDVVAFADVPESVRKDMALYSGCIAGASPIKELEAMLRDAGFQDVQVAPVDSSKTFIKDWAPGTPITDFAVSAAITGRKAV
jgi:SAM-dependent methyltransferase